MIGNAWQRLTMAAACASLISIGACGGSDENGAGDTTAGVAGGDVARDSAATAAVPGSMAGTPAAGTAATGTTAMSITGGDPELLNVIAAVDQSEIEIGQMAQRQARNAQVKAYARSLVQEHTQSLRQDRQIAKAANVTLDSSAMSGSGTSGSGSSVGASRTGASGDTTAKAAGSTPAGSTPGGAAGTSSSPVVTQLHTMHMQTMQQLRGMQGASFDSAFIASQVMGHQQVLDLLQRAQPQVQNSNLQQHVTKATQSVQKHLDRGRELQQTLASGGTAGTRGTGAGDTTGKARTGADTGRRP